MAHTDAADDKSRRERSPSFPFISLGKAIDRIRAVADAHKRSPARLITVADTWGYAPASSGLQQTASALKAYGLAEIIGKGLDRKVQLTDLAWRILHDERPGAREQAIKEAALRPRLFAEYAPHWLPDRPGDNHCISELHLDRGFTQPAAELFLRVFDETIDFANLKKGDNLSVVQQGSSPPPQVPPLESRMAPLDKWVVNLLYPGGRPTGVAPAPGQIAAALAVPRATLPLPEGTVALEMPPALSQKSYEAFKAWIEVMVSLTEKSVQNPWYVETYLPTSTKPEAAQNISNWEAVKGFIDATKRAKPDVIVRVIAPDTATEKELAELRTIGVRTF